MIKVEFTREELRSIQTTDILKKLREAGIPIKPGFIFRGVENGLLEHHEDVATGKLIYTWKGKS